MNKKKENYTDVNQLQIKKLSQIQGQQHVINVLKVNLDAYFRHKNNNSQSTFGPLLLAGASGTGKSMTSQILHAELGNTDYIETNGEMLCQSSELISMLLSAHSNSTVFIDEAQGMNLKAQNILLTAISENRVHLPKNRLGNSNQSIPLEPFVLILATTHEHQLQHALLNRIRIYCRFEYYKLTDLVNILRQRIALLSWKVESDKVLEEIAKRSKQTPRIAINRLLQMSFNVASSRGHKTITLDDSHQGFHLLQIDHIGLDQLEQKYLMVVNNNEPAALNIISSMLGELSHFLGG